MLVKDLYEIFYSSYMMKRLRPTTIAGYRTNMLLHFLPLVGEIDVKQITVDDLDMVTDQLIIKHLSNKSIVYVHATARKMFNFAVKRNFLSRNPYDSYDLPRVLKYRYVTLSPDQLSQLAEYTRLRAPAIYPAIVLAGFYGLRRGEILGLIPCLDFDVVSGVLTVSRTVSIVERREVVTPCKTEDSQRQILIAPVHQAIFAGTGKGRLIRISPTALDHAFHRSLDALSLPPVRFHDLRHSYATWMLSAGVNPKIVSNVLGHANVSITLDIYSHPDVTMQTACLSVIDKR